MRSCTLDGGRSPERDGSGAAQAKNESRHWYSDLTRSCLAGVGRYRRGHRKGAGDRADIRPELVRPEHDYQPLIGEPV